MASCLSIRMTHTRSIEDLYALLEVNPNCSPEVLNAAFKALRIKYHPDNKNTGNEKQFKRISEAFRILSDPDARARYENNLRDMARKVVGEYRILSKIAEGGFGQTYKAEHTVIGELVCIKHCHKLDTFDEEILIEEAKAMWDLRHYSVPAIRGLLRMPDKKLALVMSYVPGPTLAQIIEKLAEMNEILDPEHVAWIVERILNALRYIHYEGVVHGDLKPHNIIVAPEKHLASIVDFGLAKIKPKAGSRSKGHTEYFSAPEAIEGKSILPESDLYSLGMTMIYALSGDAECVIRKEVPSSTPKLMQDFIKRLIVRYPLSRPRWPKDVNAPDLYDEYLEVREKSFGRRRSNLKPFPKID